MAHMKKMCWPLAALVVVASSAWAQDVRISAEVSRKKIPLGESARLTVRVEGQSSADAPQVPAIDGLDVRYLGPSTQVSVINGQYSSSVAHAYSIFPLKVGSFQLPSLTVSVDGKTFQTDPIDIEVVASSAPSSTGAAAPVVEKLEDKMFVALKTPKADVYVNEPLPVKVFLFISADTRVSDVQMPQLPLDGIEKGDFKYAQYQKVVNGVRFSVVEFETVIYPLKEGSLTLGPAKIPFNMLVDVPQEDNGGFFNDPFFNSFLNRQQVQPVALTSDPVTLTVKPLPETGKPLGFSGSVGQYDFDVTVSPTEGEVGDPLTVRMKLRGQGFLSDTEFPVINESNDFKVYEPSQKTEEDTKVLEQVVIPRSDAVKEFPAVSFSYFDPADGQYHTITKGPFPLKIRPSSNKPQIPALMAALSVAAPATAVERIGEDIVFIKDSPGHLRRVDQWMYQSRMFYGVLAGYALAWLVAVIGLAFRRRLKTDTTFANRLKASRSAAQGLSRLRHAKASAEFYNQAHALLTDYFSKKLGIPAGEVGAEVVLEHPRWKKREDIDRIVSNVFAECDSVRFAPVEPSASQVQDMLKNMETVIRYAEKVIR